MCVDEITCVSPNVWLNLYMLMRTHFKFDLIYHCMGFMLLCGEEIGPVSV